ncbi:MFS transporter [Serratia ureilytica]|uniref:MFS transporter n=1 Tax=Serratia ureilytica TaxID=300181 RepID=UPI0018E7E8FC|nr:MFS transporter [Serratia ureilytica]MBJ2089987.1 MFS transporter [Serratia ureilytica]
MYKKWSTLYIIIFMYLPISIDATVLHVAIPSLATELNATGEQLLWIIDIYSLVMAGLIIPMGILCDHVGFKRLLLLGGWVFALASLISALSCSVGTLLVSRIILALGAAMILPATLAALRYTFSDENERNVALGIWSSVGTIGMIVGPLLGGWLMEHFYWGAVFIINVPLLFVVLLFAVFMLPSQPIIPQKSWHIKPTLILISSILTMIYTLKNLLSAEPNYHKLFLSALFSGGMLYWFIQLQKHALFPMFDVKMLIKKEIIAGSVIALTTMIVLVGFELLITQELQFSLGMSPLDAGLFLLPLMISCGVSGPIIGKLAAYFELRSIATTGFILSGVSLFMLAMTDISQQYYLVCLEMIILGFSMEASMLASTAAIMGAVSKEQSGSAGALEGMAYELGSGLGVTFFGSMLLSLYSASLIVPEGIPYELAKQARLSIGETVQTLKYISHQEGEALMVAARNAFSFAHVNVLAFSGAILILLSVFVGWLMPRRIK